jgi:hypothetical protein
MNDTHPEAERVQIGLIRKMSVARRAALASALSNTTYWLARRAIQRAHPELSEAEQKLLFIDVHYGPDLARRVREQWRERGIVNA